MSGPSLPSRTIGARLAVALSRPRANPLILLFGTLLIVLEVLRVNEAVYVVKPLVTALIAVMAALAPPQPSERYRLLVVGGLAISCVGDALLMLPYNLFAAGLGAFLVAHLFYVSAFATAGGGRTASKGALAVSAAIAGVMLAVLWPTLGALRVPVALYVGVIATMAWQAWGRAMALGGAAARRAAIGAALFLVSDGSLAMNRFHGPIASPEVATVIIMATYLAAQWCIASSVGD